MTEKLANACFINGVSYRCRTCFDPGSSVFSLTDECSNKKTWRDLLSEVAQLQATEDDQLPNTVCSKCLDKLITFYDFILQIKNVNNKYLELLGVSKDPLEQDVENLNRINTTNNNSLDVPMEDLISDIKTEKEELGDYDIILSNSTKVAKKHGTYGDDNQITSAQYEDNESYSSYEENNEFLPHEKPRKADVNKNKMSVWYDKIRKINDRFVCPKCKKTFTVLLSCRRHLNAAHFAESNPESSYSTSEESDDLQQNSQTGNENDIKTINNRFACPLCKKTFTLKRNCRRHIQLHFKSKSLHCGFCTLSFTSRDYLYAHIKRMHPGETMESNKKCIQRLFGDRLYSKPTAWLKVECNLCCKTFTTAKELRLHLENHNNLESLNLLKSNDSVIQHFFPNNNNLEKVKEYILKDISEKNYFKYYLVLNEYSYEMSLSDTEIEDLEEETQHTGNYKCKLCLEEFSFKYQVFSHLKEVHAEQEIPLKCKRCRLEFISVEMHEKHLQIHCRNKDKILYCKNCPGRFVWPENWKNHNCPLNISQEEQMSNEIENNEHIISDELSSNTLNINQNTVLLRNLENEEQTKSIPSNSVLQKAIIRCALCEGSFPKLQYLRQHIKLHADGKTGIDFENSAYVKVFKHTELTNYPLWQEQIADAYSKSQISQFYVAIDRDGNELDISDSDNTDDTDFGENFKTQYTCVVCKMVFYKRKFLLKHQKEQHSNVGLPFTCKYCNQQYVNFKLLQQHLKKFCCNIYRQNAKQCEFCNESFIWPDNLLKHKDIKHSQTSKHSPRFFDDIPTTSKITTTPTERSFTIDEPSIANEVLMDPSYLYYCLMCPKTFFSIEDLNDHLIQHRLTKIDIKIVESIVNSTWWPNGKKNIKCKICDLPFETMADLKKHFSSTNSNICCSNQHSIKNYLITNQKDFELHLELDSETEKEDEEFITEEIVFPYNCYICNKSFKRKYQVAQHQRSMHNYELLELKCERCLFRTVSKKILDYHKITQCFNEEKLCRCNFCNFKFTWQESLNKHILRYHTPNTNLTVETNAINTVSQNETSMQDNLQQTSETTTNNAVCSICNATFSNKQNLEIHLMRHRNEKPFKCDFCEKAFTRNFELQLHRRTHTDERPYKCPYCEKSFRECGKLNIHKRLHTGERPYECTHCPKKFNKPEQLKRHILSHKPYVCNVCNKGFVAASYLRGHRKEFGHLETDEKSTTKKEQNTPTVKNNLCPLCGIHLSFNTSITNHMRIHTGVRPHKCDLCEMTFIRNSDMVNHRRIHTDEKPFKCTECEKSFRTAGKLTIHKRLHTGERPYKCTFCEKTFNNSHNCKLHMRLHTGEKPFMCEVCDMTFLCARYLKKHRIKKGHNAENE